VLSASGDSTARVWNADGTGAELVLRGHRGVLTGASFIGAGSRVVTASADGTVRVWRTGWSDLASHLAAITTACLTTHERQKLLRENAKTAAGRHRECELRHQRRGMPVDVPDSDDSELP
jgi:WD40 repeat protein